MNPEMRAALAALIRQYLEQTAKAEVKGPAKAAGKGAAKALPKGTKIPPVDMGTADARFWTPGANVPAAVGPQGLSTVTTQGATQATGGVGQGMATGDWMTPGAAATAIGAAMLLRQMAGDSTQNATGPVTPDQAAGVPYGPMTPQQANVPMPTAPPVPVPTAAPHPIQSIAPQTAYRSMVPPPQLSYTSPNKSEIVQTAPGQWQYQAKVPQVAPPDVGLSFAKQLGQPEVYGMLGQLAQAVAPGSFGANLGGFASSRAQGILTNQALQSLLAANPTLGLSDAAAGTLGPQAIAALGQQALQYDLGSDQNAIRSFEAESPEQRLMREYIIATARPQADRSFKAAVTVNEKGQSTPGQEHLWLFDEQGNRVKYLGGQAVAERAGQSPDDLAGKRANQLRFNLESARKEALTLTAMEFKEVMIADPNDPANFIINPYAPPEALARFKENYIRAVQDRQDNNQLPDNLAVLGQVVRKRGTVLQQAATPGPVAPRRSINDVR